jgi:hypothetical protein
MARDYLIVIDLHMFTKLYPDIPGFVSIKKIQIVDTI